MEHHGNLPRPFEPLGLAQRQAYTSTLKLSEVPIRASRADILALKRPSPASSLASAIPIMHQTLISLSNSKRLVSSALPYGRSVIPMLLQRPFNPPASPQALSSLKLTLVSAIHLADAAGSLKASKPDKAYVPPLTLLDLQGCPRALVLSTYTCNHYLYAHGMSLVHSFLHECLR
uniref:Uncharacterized protein n=1 Tax=Moniliophthora roreri TaxID=221103 RepID=A0A0W0FCZ7_MONRR